MLIFLKPLSSLIAKADAEHPSLARLTASIASAEEAVTARAAQQALTAEQEAERQAQLQVERQQQQQEQQAQAAQQLAAQQAEQQAAARREAEERAAAERETQAAAQRAAQQQAAQQAAPAPSTPAPAASTLRALSTPAPAYPPEALRSGRSGEVQVEFTVNPDGSVADARVIRADPPRVFDRAALNAVRRWRFEPVAAPVTTRRTIGFTPAS